MPTSLRRSPMLGCLLEPSPGYLQPGAICAFGSYFPKSRPEHWNSSWSQITLRVKRLDAWSTTQVGRIMAEHLVCWLDPALPYILTPVPSNRPSNPNRTASGSLADAITASLAGRMSVTREELLIEARKRSGCQHRCRSTHDRIRNVCGRYGSRGIQAGNQSTVLLVDDIITTGSTMRECFRILAGAGFTRVIGLAMARTAAQGA